jgi:hypothetical protein
MESEWFRCCLVFIVLATVSGFAAAQDATTAPPPPADTQAQSLQEPAPATDVRAVRLSDVQGTVQILNDSEVAFRQAQLNMPVIQGMKLVTAEDGRAEIQFEDGGVVRITPSSSITLTQLGRNPDGSTVTVIQADGGLTYYELNGRAGQYTVHFGQGSLGQDTVIPNDSSIFRLDLDSAPTELAVTHGSVHVSNDQGLSTDVHTNQSARFDVQNPNEYQLVESVAANSWDQWNSDRDEALAELDDSATEARASTGSPDNPAWSDLDASGNWYNVPGYGTGWAPSGVGDDWDPYGLGSWGYYNGIGYTWISGYQWGWWPYRCGAWSWFDGFGWMWFPGNCGWGGGGADAGWYPYGVIWAVPPGYRSPRRPRRIRHPEPHPGHGPIPHEPLIAVDRGPQFTQQFKSVGGTNAGPRIFQYAGRNIAPVGRTIHPHQGGPLGESFTSTIERSNPEILTRPVYGGMQYRPQGGHSAYQPSRIYTPPPSRPIPADGGRAPAPVFRSPPPVVHAAPPAAASHPHR